MGQYHYVVNLDKREFIHPHQIGCGLKLWEQMANNPSTGTALVVLLACSNGRGGGDLRASDPDGMIGRWAGDRIAIIGDYGEPGDLPREHMAETLYTRCGLDPSDYDDEDIPPGPVFENITEKVARIIEVELHGTFEGDGWRRWKPDGADEPSPHQGKPDMVISDRDV